MFFLLNEIVFFWGDLKCELTNPTKEFFFSLPHLQNYNVMMMKTTNHMSPSRPLEKSDNVHNPHLGSTWIVRSKACNPSILQP
jgi:hypothetical protein